MKKSDAIGEYMREIGARGGKARAATLSADRRREIATKASQAAKLKRSKTKKIPRRKRPDTV